VTVSAELTPTDDAPAGSLSLHAAGLMLDERLKRNLPASWRKVYEQLSPTGQVDVDLDLENSGAGRWEQRKFVLTAKKCTCAHAVFPYRINEVSGTIERVGRDLRINFDGFAARQNVHAEGLVRNAGPEAETTIDIDVKRLPIDDTFVYACPASAQRALSTLNLAGYADIDLLLFRPAGLNKRMQWKVASRVHDGSLKMTPFPYRLTQVSADVSYSTAAETWEFKNVQAKHETATIDASGTFARVPAALALSVNLRHAAIDEQLQAAMRMYAPSVFHHLVPMGKLDADATIDWSPGRLPRVELTRAVFFDGNLTPRAFPFSFEGVRAEFKYKPNPDERVAGRVEVQSFNAHREQTSLSANGAFSWSASGWELDIKDLIADDVVADQHLRRALPPGLRRVIEQLNPVGPVSLVNGDLYFRGTANPADPVTAAWNLKTVLDRNSISAGVEVKQASGKVTCEGTIDHLGSVRLGGQLDIESIFVRDYQFTQVRGPFQLTGRRLSLGSPEALDPVDGSRHRNEIGKRITARAVGGFVTLDAIADLGEPTSYHALLTLSKGDLEQYAQRYMRGTKNIRGIVNGWIELQGRGATPQGMTGRGQLQASPAALYELPVIAQIFARLSFSPPDKTAFRYAFADFEVGRGQFNFQRIDLIGDTISLGGHGTAQFDPPDGRLNLEFVTKQPQNQLSIPLVNMLADEAARALVGISVTGTTDTPIAQIKPVPVLDDAMRQFQSMLEGRPPGNMPLLLIPPLLPAPQPQPTHPQTYGRQPMWRR
jgi:hypothetical protein